ncbi:MAG: ABC transporter ATP-binding protein [Hyphomicrobiales bacterium]|nr:ABC transporter ATP-binding protein [Hyphomicrobiales bacterium]
MTASAKPIDIRLTNCAKTFQDGTRALEPLDLQIDAGETVVLLGPSGCGKTTTLRIIAGLESPDPGGRVMFGDDDVTHQPIERRNVGMVFQSYALFPNMTVEQNVAYGLTVRKVADDQKARRVGEMLDMMQITELATRNIDQLSGGQRQRVALARAIAVRPRVLLLDEPLTALDALLRERLRVEIDQLLRGLGITAIYVTHDQNEAMALGDRIVVMNHGVVAQIGGPRDIYYRPANSFVADFIGTINKLHGSTRNGKLETASGTLPWSGSDSTGSVFLFRPEDASIVPLNKSQLRGHVIASYFLGDRTKILLGGIGEQTVVVETTDRVEFSQGQEIGLTIKPDALMKLD